MCHMICSPTNDTLKLSHEVWRPPDSPSSGRPHCTKEGAATRTGVASGLAPRVVVSKSGR